MRIVYISTVLLLLAGCASESGQTGARTPVTVVADTSTDLVGKTKVVCRKETPPGSHMIQNVCETERSEADRQQMQYQIMNAVQQNKGLPGPPGTH